ncbi:hypothetical protein BDN70DRAFT_900510 [Pholiota conissans]|uniref:Ubiquitin-like protease family profile domain-containing protein n=1 Tax=Pholiota conissans TaxID=109636 RepID=A0A9P5YMG7_9AGAR|nr:hypothetical protein BDN70DRAFT_900510 [Pholiota conissans]
MEDALMFTNLLFLLSFLIHYVEIIGNNHSLQTDGASCGFWGATFALLIIFEINPSSPANKKVLKKLGATGLKNLWRNIMVNFLQDPIGLQASVLQEFLSLFQDWQGFPDRIDCIGPRPSYMSHPKALPLLEIKTPVIDHNDFQEDHNDFQEVDPKSTAEIDILQLLRLQLLNWVNDEIVNTWLAIMNHRFESSEDFNFWIATSFFFQKLTLWYQQKNGPKKSQEFDKLRRFYQKPINILELNSCFLPIHLPNLQHWLLAVINFDTSSIYLLDSWEPTQQANRKIRDWKKAKGSDIIMILVAWLDAEAASQQVDLYD